MAGELLRHVGRRDAIGRRVVIQQLGDDAVGQLQGGGGGGEPRESVPVVGGDEQPGAVPPATPADLPAAPSDELLPAVHDHLRLARPRSGGAHSRGAAGMQSKALNAAAGLLQQRLQRREQSRLAAAVGTDDLAPPTSQPESFEQPPRGVLVRAKVWTACGPQVAGGERIIFVSVHRWAARRSAGRMREYGRGRLFRCQGSQAGPQLKRLFAVDILPAFEKYADPHDPANT